MATLEDSFVSPQPDDYTKAQPRSKSQQVPPLRKRAPSAAVDITEDCIIDDDEPSPCVSPTPEAFDLDRAVQRQKDADNGSSLFRFRLFQTTKEKLYNIVRSYRYTPYYSPHTPIFLLGHAYDVGSDVNIDVDPSNMTLDELLRYSAQAQKFLDDFSSLYWFTYRNRFPPFANSSLSSDMGWGCMIRSGQMLLCNAIVSATRELDRHTTGQAVLEWFIDHPGPDHPFSIHNILAAGSYFQVKPGDWLSPSVIAHILKILVRRYRPLGLNMYVAKENTIYKDVLHRLCKTAPAGMSEEECTTVPTNFKPVLIVIPCRPGINTIEESYIPVLKSFLSSPLSLGIIGGKPNLSLYFIGFQKDDLILLDPHQVQPTPPENDIASYYGTYHCRTPYKLPLNQVDPSMAIAFLCCKRKELEEFYTLAETVYQQTGESLFEVVDSRPSPQTIHSSDVKVKL